MAPGPDFQGPSAKVEGGDIGEEKDGLENMSDEREANQNLLYKTHRLASHPRIPLVQMRDLIKSAQELEENKVHLNDQFGGTLALAANLGVDLTTGVSPEQAEELREMYGRNSFPEVPMKGFWKLFVESFNDTILLVLIAAAVVSLVVGVAAEDSETGWIEGVAILIAVLIVALVTAGNDYTKELQFRALEKTSEGAERCVVLRNGETQQLHPEDLVVGDVVFLKPGDGIPADGIVFEGEGVKSNESGLTGEPDDLEKSAAGDMFLYSSCTVTEVGRSAEVRMMVAAVGESSQWGKIKAKLSKPPTTTPLQDKLDRMATLIGYIGFFFAILTFSALLIMIWTQHDGEDVLHHVIEAFIIGVTIIVVAIPEGLPLAVTISLAYSTRKMYADQNLIRVLAACETMGNATNICSDKTGTLTMNQMTVVEGWFFDQHLTEDNIRLPSSLSPPALEIITQHVAVNRSVEVHFTDSDGKNLHKPKVIGNATEGSLVLLATEWGCNAEAVKKQLFDPAMDVEYPFNSKKKRSSCLITKKPGPSSVDKNGTGLRFFLKGASEDVLGLCSHYSDQSGQPQIMTAEKRAELGEQITAMANRALRTLLIAHRDYASEDELPADYKENSPDSNTLCCDAIVGIMDPLRDDVKEAVRQAQHAGVMVRMVTGDNIDTARAIARDCGIYQDDRGLAMTGPEFRALTPKQLDEILPRLQVLARSTPNDKYLLVTRLNGVGIPTNEAQWREMHDHDGSKGLNFEELKHTLLPGMRQEWEERNPGGGEVVGVTGDGTNDAPALKAANVGLAMGITGTKVAQNASDIVILDDKFSSIVRAIMWGRSVYDNIRKFLQFQLTVNVVALLLVFIGSVAGFDPPLNAVMMLWVNLIMDTMGALALGTESPTLALLERRPYGRNALLISRPMIRNIAVQSIYQLALLLWLLFDIRSIFPSVGPNNPCKKWEMDGGDGAAWDVSGARNDASGSITCSFFETGGASGGTTFPSCIGGADNRVCYEDNYDYLDEFDDTCLDCEKYDYVHYSIIFNAFVFCQIFNEFNARSIFDKVNVFEGLATNGMFITVIVLTIAFQIFVIQIGGEFTQTAGLSVTQWLVSSGLGLVAIPLGMAMRFIPVVEDPRSFSGYEPIDGGKGSGGSSINNHGGIV